MLKMEWAPHTIEARKKLVGEAPLLMTTYRKGTKWLDPAIVDQMVGFVPTGGDIPFAYARVVSVKACLFKDIDLVDDQRQSSEMTPEARLEVMQKAYGAYTMHTLTTVVTLGDIRSA